MFLENYLLTVFLSYIGMTYLLGNIMTGTRKNTELNLEFWGGHKILGSECGGGGGGILPPILFFGIWSFYLRHTWNRICDLRPATFGVQKIGVFKHFGFQIFDIK